MNAREEIEDLLDLTLNRINSTATYEEVRALASAILDAGYRKPLRVNTHEELARMSDGTVIQDWNGGVGEKRDWPLDLAVRYVDRTTEVNADIPLPAVVLYDPREGQ